jgi:acyl-CoA dehydrogenase
MNFSLTEEQRLIVEATNAFVVRELYPHEAEIEATGRLRPELRDELRRKAQAAGLYAANMPVEVGGAGLDTLTWMLFEKELGRANYALHWTCVARPSNILLACEGDQRERYLLPAVRGEKSECLAMSEPDVGSDLRGMKTRARRDGDDFVIHGTSTYQPLTSRASSCCCRHRRKIRCAGCAP